MERNYVAFISYRHAEMDSAIAKALHTSIEQYRIPKGLQKDGKKRLGLVFRDEEELHAASDLTAEIQQALINTQFLIVICSKNSIQSPWVGREIDYFLQHHDRSQILAVLASGEPNEVFPPQLTLTPDGELIEPLAVDVRADTIKGNKKKIRRELPRLISSILDCPYDALVMREQKRKMRRITSVAAGIMAILLGFTSMVLAKNQQIELANTQLEHKNTELNDANTALAEQKAAVQLRESQLLTQNAQEDMANADYYRAIETALSALPKDAADNRPYYAPAENVLMDAMGIFQIGSPATSLNTTALEQVTDISDYVVNEDGTRIVTVDKFGTVFCFDSQSGEQLWNRYAAPDDGANYGSPHVFLCNGDNTVVRNTHKALEAYDLQTGDALWSTKVDFIVKDYLFYNRARDTLVLATYRTVEIFSTGYQLVEISTATGQVLQTIPFYLSPSSNSLIFSQDNKLSKGGLFTKDGTCFYGVFIDNDKILQCFTVDLIQGTSKILYTHDTPMSTSTDVLGMVIQPSGQLDIVLKNPDVDTMLCAMALDLQTGKQCWQQTLPLPDTYLPYTYPAHVLFFVDRFLVCCNDTFYFFDATNGDILITKTAPSPVTSLTFVSDSTFGLSLNSGDYAIGWINDNIVLTTDSAWQVSADISEHSAFQVWGGGIIQMYSDDSRFLLNVGNHVSPGYVSLIPREAKNTIQVLRPAESLRVLEYTPLESLPADLRDATGFKIRQVEDSLLAGPFLQNDDYSTSHYYSVSANGQVAKAFQVQGSYSAGEIYCLPDTQQALICSNYDGIFTLDANGNQTTLYDGEADQKKLSEKYDFWSAFSLFRCGSEYISDGHTLLTAACNPDVLRVWQNGQFLIETNLPEELLIAPEDSSNMTRLAKVGENGWILTSLHEYDGAIPAQMMAAYNPSQNLWTRFRTDAVFADHNAIAAAQDKHIVAAVDQDGSLLILDLNTGNVITHFATQVPSGSVKQLQFFLDDTHLAIKAAGGHLLIYEIATGQLRYRGQCYDTYSTTLQIFEDPAHGRLYLNCGDRSGLCLDLDSWTSLANCGTLLYHDSRSNRTYLSPNSYNAPPVYYGTIPDTLELIGLAAKTLAENN